MQNNSDFPHPTRGEYPFQQQIKKDHIERQFSVDVEDSELKWHVDEKDRVVTILESNGWGFQMDDNLPNKLYDDQEIFIPKFVWHRVIKGNGDLKISIKEID